MVHLLLCIPRGALGPKTIEKAIKEFAESKGATFTNVTVWDTVNVVDRGPLFEVGDKVLATIEKVFTQCVVKSIDPTPTEKGWYTEVEIPASVMEKLNWRSGETAWMYDSELHPVLGQV